MNDNDLISKLKTLKRFEPRDSTMSSIRERVMKETGVGKQKQAIDFAAFFRQMFAPRYQLAYALVLILAVGFMLRPINPMTRATETMHVAVTSLHGASDQTQIFAQEKNLDQARTQLASLNLNGEPGKYTREQCHQLYETYEAYLQEYKQRVTGVLKTSGQNDAKTQQLYEKITHYQQEVETKWPAVK